jgi:hypothetical protein
MTISLISTVTASGSSAAIDFASISQSFTDLFAVISGRTSATGNIVSTLQFNSDTGANYSFRYLQGTGGAASSSAGTGTTSIQLGYANDAGTTASTFCSQSIYIPNYTSASAKSISVDSVQENNGAQGLSWINAGRWTGTAAITFLSFGVASGNWVSGSTISLYGILKGSGGATVT